MRVIHTNPPRNSMALRFKPINSLLCIQSCCAVWQSMEEAAGRHGSFFYTPSAELHFSQLVDGRIKQEIDILCITDGELLLGEIKEGDLHASDFTKIATIVEKIQPDRAALFVTQEEYIKEKSQGWFKEFKERIALLGIRAEWFSLSSY
jgi:hypothetical protein